VLVSQLSTAAAARDAGAGKADEPDT
jgi:hypothetical protein